MLEENYILISQLNDFIFCPVSIYFHTLYESLDKTLYQRAEQINGTHAHKAIDSGQYSSKKNVLQGMDVYSEKFNIRGKIDVFDADSGVLTERKKNQQNIRWLYFSVVRPILCFSRNGVLREKNQISQYA